jgi:hypothetical protein
LVRFFSPDCKKKELSTKERDVRKAHQAAIRKIYLEFGNYKPPTPQDVPTAVIHPLGWNDAESLLILNMKMSGLQGSTIEQYMIAVRALRKTFPDTDGPAEITSEMAETFRGRRLATGASKGTVASNLMTLSTIYARWWCKACEMLDFNPFDGVKVLDRNGSSHNDPSIAKI